MKKKNGSVFEYERERNADLIRAFDEQIRMHYHKRIPINLAHVFRNVSNMPSKRFWVTEERAAIVVSNIIKGDSLAGMGPMKREMFMEIYRRTLILQREHPGMSLYKIVTKVCAQPAPKFYLTPGSVKVIIYKIKRQWYEERKRKLQF